MGHSRNFADRLASCVERLAESGVAALGGQATLVQVARNPRTFCRAQEPWAYLLRMVRNGVEQGAELWNSMAASRLILPAEARTLSSAAPTNSLEWTKMFFTNLDTGPMANS